MKYKQTLHFEEVSDFFQNQIIDGASYRISNHRIENFIKMGKGVEVETVDLHTREKLKRILFSFPRLPDDKWEELRQWSVGDIEESDLAKEIESMFYLNRLSIKEVILKKIDTILSKLKQ